MLERHWRVCWLREGLLAISPMPSSWDLERVAREFRSVVSLCSPSEHSYAGYDPRLLGELGVKVLCTPVPPQQAPRLSEALKALLWYLEAPKPLLVHSMRGCGRAVMMASLLLSATERTPPLRVLAELAELRGCGLESLPQKTVVYAAYYLARSLDLREKELILRASERPEVLEYACLLGAHLSSLGLQVSLRRVIEHLAGKRVNLEPVEETVVMVSEELAKILDYTVSGLSATKRGEGIVVRLVQWLPRAAHPRAVLRDRGMLSRMVKEFELVASDLEARASRALGLPVKLASEWWPPTETPPPTLL